MLYINHFSINLFIFILLNCFDMNLQDKKSRLSVVKSELSHNIMQPNGFIKNIGKVFFTLNDGGWVLRDVVFYGSKRHGINFEVLSLDGKYFVGSKEHAAALFNAFGGKYYPSEYCYIADDPRDLWIWTGEKTSNNTPISMEDAQVALFG